MRSHGGAGRRRSFPRWRSSIPRRTSSNSTLRWSKRLVLGLGRIYAERVIHLCAQNGEPEFGMACATAGADLHGKVHRHARVRLLRGSGLGASVSVRVR